MLGLITDIHLKKLRKDILTKPYFGSLMKVSFQKKNTYSQRKKPLQWKDITAFLGTSWQG